MLGKIESGRRRGEMEGGMNTWSTGDF